VLVELMTDRLMTIQTFVEFVVVNIEAVVVCCCLLHLLFVVQSQLIPRRIYFRPSASEAGMTSAHRTSIHRSRSGLTPLTDSLGHPIAQLYHGGAKGEKTGTGAKNRSLGSVVMTPPIHLSIAE
jgi:hypothetical protein